MATPQEDSSLLKEKKKSGCCNGQFPPSVLFILGTEFCERFSFYGMKAILVIYLTQWLMFGEDKATAIFHAFSMLCYVTPCFGGMIADSFLGKFKTIFYLSCVYFVGSLLMSLTALPPPEWYGAAVALLLIAFGTGGIKPCVAAFGGDQFSPEQETALTHFFTIFYFMINLGSLISTLLTPVLRAHVTCFGGECYPLAFGIPAILMAVSIVFFVAGKNSYKINMPTGNVISKVFGCICQAWGNKCADKGADKRDHWLDYADDKYEAEFIEDVKSLLRVLVMFIPLPIFWALFDQQGSRWTLQAVKLNGDIGALGHLQPDQMQALNPVFIILFLPLFDFVIYPLLDKCHIPNRPLQRMVAGMALAGTAFVVAGFLQLRIDASLDQALEEGQSELRFINAMSCSVHVDTEFYNDTIMVSHDSGQLFITSGNYSATLTATENAAHPCGLTVTTTTLALPLLTQQRYFVVAAEQAGSLEAKLFSYDVTDPQGGGALVSIVYAGEPTTDVTNIRLDNIDTPQDYYYNITGFEATPFVEIKTGSYRIIVLSSDGSEKMLANTLMVASGGMYTVVIQPNITNHDEFQMVDYVDQSPHLVSILDQIPQYVLITSGEVVFSVTGLSFAYSQAPMSMKSVLQAAWLLTVGFGNLIVIIVAEVHVLEQAAEFFLFACLMFLDVVIFGIMAWFYKYTNVSGPDYMEVGTRGSSTADETDSHTASLTASEVTQPKPEDDSQI